MEIAPNPHFVAIAMYDILLDYGSLLFANVLVGRCRQMILRYRYGW